MSNDLENKLAELPGAAKVEARSDGLWMDAPEIDAVALAKLVKTLEGRLSTISAVALKDEETELIYHFMVGKSAINVKLHTKENHAASITPVLAAANWIEREIHDLYGVVFTGHPNLARLLRPVQLQEGFFRKG